jgi:hypothetical protein
MASRRRMSERCPCVSEHERVRAFARLPNVFFFLLRSSVEERRSNFIYIYIKYNKEFLFAGVDSTRGSYRSSENDRTPLSAYSPGGRYARAPVRRRRRRPKRLSTQAHSGGTTGEYL